MSSMNKDPEQSNPTRFGVSVDEFIVTTREALDEAMCKLSPSWRTRLDNYHEFIHDKAMKAGFWLGAIFSCSIVLMILFISRVISK